MNNFLKKWDAVIIGAMLTAIAPEHFQKLLWAVTASVAVMVFFWSQFKNTD